MSRAPIVSLAIKSLAARRAGVALTVLSVALAVMLFVGVEKSRNAVRDSFERTISGADLVVGARSGQINLLLYSIFHMGDATANVTWATYEDVSARPEVAWSVPISLGDSHRGYRVVGTTEAFFERYKYGDQRDLSFAAGGVFDDVFDVVLGADVAASLEYGLGDEIVIAHGLGSTSFAQHDDKPFRVSGVLARTGTPVDKSVMVGLAAIEAIHVGWEQGYRSPRAAAATPERIREMALEPDEITAFIMGLKDRRSVIRLQRDINTYEEEPLTAIIPGVALAQLWRIAGVAEAALAAIAGFVVLIGLFMVLTSVSAGLRERRREMAVLRAVGARPRDVAALLVSEAGVLGFVGAGLGVALLYGLFPLVEPLVAARTGMSFAGARPGLFDLAAVCGVGAASALMAAIPAWRATRSALADGLAMKY